METDRYHEVNRKSWDAVSDWWQENMYAPERWQLAATNPNAIFKGAERRLLGDVAGRSVCVLASGNNLIAIAFASIGAVVTSVDISEAQLEHARKRVADLGLSFRFIRADVVNLSTLQDSEFDIVYTGGGVADWIADLRAYYSEAVRILKPGGTLIIRDAHPFRAIWKDQEPLELAFSYLEVGPGGQPEYGDRSKQTVDQTGESVPSYLFHWTVGERVMAVLDAGCRLLHLEELGTKRQSWQMAPVEGLPAELLLVAQKEQPGRGNST